MKYTYVAFAVISLTALIRGERPGYGEDCSVNSYCRSNSNLQCNGRICQCEYGTAYDSKTERCVYTVGSSCSRSYYSSRECPTGSYCNQTTYYMVSMPNDIQLPPSIRKVLSQRYSPTDERCICKPGLRPSKEYTRCVKTLPHGANCTNNELAEYGLDCDRSAGLHCGPQGTCACASTNMTYDTVHMKCAARLGESCNQTTTQCEGHTICSSWLPVLRRVASMYSSYYYSERSRLSEDPAQSTCVCAPGFSATSNGTCLGAQGQTCSDKSSCNWEQFLTCVNGLCQCESSSIEIFSEELNKTLCHIVHGAPCSKDKGAPCSQNAVCTNGYCACAEGYYPGQSGSCHPNFGSKCGNTPSTSCDELRGLACIESVCACFDASLTWNSKMNQCTASAGGVCGAWNQTFNQHEVIYESGPGYRSSYFIRDPLFPVPAERRSIANPFNVTCGEGLTCTKDHTWGNVWNRCVKK